MRISDWSSDVCSSDLALFLDHHAVTPGEGLGDQLLRRIERLRPVGPRDRAADRPMFGAVPADHHQRLAAIPEKAIQLRHRSAADEPDANVEPPRQPVEAPPPPGIDPDPQTGSTARRARGWH